MKKALSLFLVLIIVFSFIGCSATTSEEIATTNEPFTLSHEDEVNEVVQWATINIINKNSVQRYVKTELYKDVKEELESYIASLPSNLAPTSFSFCLISMEIFEIRIVF